MNTIVYSENEGGVSRAPEFDKQITVTLNQRDYVEVLRLKDTLSNAEFDEEKSNQIFELCQDKKKLLDTPVDEFMKMLAK